jgi:rubrerythrin
MDRLAQKNREKVIDLLMERLSFERAGVKLYDKVLERMRDSSGARGGRHGGGDYTTYGLSGYRGGDVERGVHEDIDREQGSGAHRDLEREREERVVAEMLPLVEKIRAQEKEHEEWLKSCIRRLGGDDKRMTEMANVTAREAAGIEKVVMKDPQLPHLFHALLAAEHVDTAGWDLLLVLAAEAGDDAAEEEFRKRLEEEERHLAFLREALRTFSAHEVLGEELHSPTPPV